MAISSTGMSANNAAQLNDIAQKYGNRFVRALGHKLSAGIESVCILKQGDSSLNDSNEAFSLAMAWLGTKYLNYTVYTRTWSHTTQSYSGFGYPIQTGTAGAAYVLMSGASGCYLSCPDAVVFDITGNLDASAKWALDDWTPAGISCLVGKWETVGQYSWKLSINTDGKVIFSWSEDGTNVKSVMSTVSPGFTNGYTRHVRAYIDVDNGAGGNTVTFSYGTNGFVWTQLGDPVVTAGVTSIYAGTSNLSIGGLASGTTERTTGKFYSAVIQSGELGTVVASPDAALAFPSIATTFKDVEGNTWTVNGNATIGNGAPGLLWLNAGTSGQAIAYSTDPTRFALQAAYEPQLAFINYGHNEGTTVSGYQTTYEGLCTQLLTKWPNVGVICMTQNPRVSPASYITQHAQRNAQIAILAAKNDYGLIDAYRKFITTPDYASYIKTDGIHPTVTGDTNGSYLWRDEIISFLKASIAA